MTSDLRNMLDENDLERFVLDACYEGERSIINGSDGPLAAIIPIEDLLVLEEIERASEAYEPYKLRNQRKKQL